MLCLKLEVINFPAGFMSLGTMADRPSAAKTKNVRLPTEQVFEVALNAQIVTFSSSFAKAAHSPADLKMSMRSRKISPKVTNTGFKSYFAVLGSSDMLAY